MIIDYSERDTIDDCPNELRAGIDWISFTINPSENMTEIDVIEYLGMSIENFTQLQRGANGYRSCLRYKASPLKILYNGQKNMGVHVDVPASGISELLSSWGKKNRVITPFHSEAIEYHDFRYSLLLDLLDSLSQIAKFTRLDLAIDDIREKYYTCDDIVTLIENHQIVSKFKKYDVRSPRNLKDGTPEGYTIYIGSRKSDVMLRVYDKRLEFFNKYHEICPYSWTRWELELKKDRANQTVKWLLETCSLSTVCMGILGQYIRIVELDNPVKSRCSTTVLWEQFIDEHQKISLYIPEDPKSLEDTKQWVDKYVGASLAAIIEADGGSLEFIYNNLPKWQIKRKQNKPLTNRMIQAMKLTEKSAAKKS